MKKMFLCSILFSLMMCGMAHAALTTIGTATYNGQDYKLIWDDDNNGNSVVWLDYTNVPENWADQKTWAAGLDTALTNIDLYDGYTVAWEGSWRLPITSGASASEMGALYEALSSSTSSDFSNLDSSAFYWSDTEHSDFYAWCFKIGDGTQSYTVKGFFSSVVGIALRNGQVSAVPIPGAILLLGSGLLAMAAAGRKKR